MMKPPIDEKYPMISYDSWIDRFVLDCPDGDTVYFRDYKGAEDYFVLNYEKCQ